MSDEVRHLPSHPLTVVCAEFKVSGSKSVEDAKPVFKDLVRKRYPDEAKRINQEMLFIRTEQGEQHFKVDEKSEWMFTNAEKNSAVLVGSDRLVVFTSDYSGRYPQFKRMFCDLLGSYAEAFDPQLLHQVGLRNNNHIVCAHGDEDLAQYVDSNLLPIKTLSEFKSSIHRVDAQLITDAGTLRVRSLWGNLAHCVSPDLAPLISIIPNGKPLQDRPTILLDFDHIWMSGSSVPTFDTIAAIDTLDRLHEPARNAFWKITTSYAHNLWEREKQ
jgi:uncharacterized protein (TIGR04255 family)